MRLPIRSLVLIFVWIGLLFPAAGLVHAQTAGLQLGLIFPNEGETLYAGPTSMLYSLPVRGWALSWHYPEDQIEIVVRVWKDGVVVVSAYLYPDANGYWTLPVTINPGADIENFPLEHRTCAPECHYLSEVILPPGWMVLEVTARDPAGSSVTLQRNIAVDRSDYVRLPVRVVLEGRTDQSLAGIPVLGAARLYLWRTRYAMVSTSPDGSAELRLEHLSLAPTRYVIQIEPVIVKGVKYESVSPVEVWLPAGAVEVPEIVLEVHACAGSVMGSLSSPVGLPREPGKIWAVREADGRAFPAAVAENGTFSYADLPLGSYVFTLDPALLAAQGYLVIPVRLDLADTLDAKIQIDLVPAGGNVVRGQVIDAGGNPLPFAWVTSMDGESIRTDPSGAFVVFDRKDQGTTFEVRAPGYYSQVRRFAPDKGIKFVLELRPETMMLEWGDGAVIIPPETSAELSAGQIRLDRGWLWGYSPSGGHLQIRVGRLLVLPEGGRFAIEHDPASNRSWLYVLEGVVTVHDADALGVQTVAGGNMLALQSRPAASTVPLDPLVIRALAPVESLPINAVWKPGLWVRFLDEFARAGVSIARIVTSVTYGLILLIAVLFPLVGLYSLVRHQSHSD